MKREIKILNDRLPKVLQLLNTLVKTSTNGGQLHLQVYEKGLDTLSPENIYN